MKFYGYLAIKKTTSQFAAVLGSIIRGAVVRHFVLGSLPTTRTTTSVFGWRAPELFNPLHFFPFLYFDFLERSYTNHK